MTCVSLPSSLPFAFVHRQSAELATEEKTRPVYYYKTAPGREDMCIAIEPRPRNETTTGTRNAFRMLWFSYFSSETPYRKDTHETYTEPGRLRR